MCIYIFGHVICIDNVILVSCVTALFALISYVKRKYSYWKMKRDAQDPDKIVNAEEVFERLDDAL